MSASGTDGTFTITTPHAEPLPRSWWRRLLRRPVRFRSVPRTTAPLPYGASAADVQAALNLPNTRVVKQADGTCVLTYTGATNEVSE